MSQQKNPKKEVNEVELPDSKNWLFEKTLTYWLHEEYVNAHNQEIDYAMGQLLTFLEATIPNPTQLKASKDVVKNILQKMRTGFYDRNNRICEDIAAEIDGGKNSDYSRTGGMSFDYTYTRAKK